MITGYVPPDLLKHVTLSRPIAQRVRIVTTRIARLKEQLSSRTRNAFRSDSNYQTWLGKTKELLTELKDELSVLNEPGEYDQLPPAVVAEELGTTTDKVRLLIKGGEILATGKAAHGTWVVKNWRRRVRRV